MTRSATGLMTLRETSVAMGGPGLKCVAFFMNGSVWKQFLLPATSLEIYPLL